MKRSLPSYPVLVLGAVVVAVAVVLVFAASSSAVAFGTYNPSWDGTSELRTVADSAGVEREIVRNTSGYATNRSARTLAIVLSPQSAYGQREADRISSFVRNGGTLLVAGDSALANNLLAGVGARARFDQRTLRDDQRYYRSPALPVAPNVSNHRFTTGVERLTLNHGTAISPNNTTVLVATSEFAYLDTSGNGKVDPSESLRTRPVATVEQLGKGRVVAVSDPSIFINTMLARSGNRAFAEALFETHDRLLLDVSHAGELPPLVVGTLVLRETPFLQFIVGCIGVAAIGIAVGRPELFTHLRNRWNGPSHPVSGASPAELAAVVRNRHPDWDNERVQRVIRAVINRREDVSANDRSE